MKAIRFDVDKRGKLLAYRWRGDMGCNAPPDTLGRWFRVGVEAAQLEIAAGKAYRYDRPLTGTTPDDLATN